MPVDVNRESLARFFGVRLRLVALILGVGLGGGALGAGYMGLLDVTAEVLGPAFWSDGEHVVVLSGVGVVVAVLVARLGRPADVELLVGNVHVPGTTDGADAESDSTAPTGRLRSLIPVSLLCIGAGGTLGPEAPLVTTTGTLATRVARWAELDEHDVRILAITGMAAGFSVLFGAPLGAAVFALEIPHRRGLEYYEALVPATMGALCGFVVSTAAGGIGLEPVWNLAGSSQLSEIDLAWALLAGLLGAAIGVAFTITVDVFHSAASFVPAGARPIAGGLILGLLALVSPYALTNGEGQIDALGAAAPVASTLVLAAGIKLLGAAVALVTGWRGGFIIPLFFAGFTLGWAVADWLPIEHEMAFVAATMVAANVAVTKTPIGSTLVVTKMAGLTLGPASLIGALTSLVVTSPVALIENQRRRFDAYDRNQPKGTEAS